MGLPPDGILKPLYAGAAPGLAAGVTQINFRVPTDGMRAGLLPLLFEYLGPSIADFPESQLGVHFYVK